MKKLITLSIITYALSISSSAYCMLARTSRIARTRKAFIPKRTFRISSQAHSNFLDRLDRDRKMADIQREQREHEEYCLKDPNFLKKVRDKQLEEISVSLQKISTQLEENKKVAEKNNEFLRNILKQNVLLARLSYDGTEAIYLSSRTYHDIDHLAKEAWFYNETKKARGHANE